MIAFQSLDILFCIYLFINDFHLLPYAFFVDGFEYFLMNSESMPHNEPLCTALVQNLIVTTCL